MQLVDAAAVLRRKNLQFMLNIEIGNLTLGSAGVKERLGSGREAWATFLKAFNEWAHQRGGIPLLNQSPFVKKQHALSAYGDRWTKLADWLKTIDPNRRMVNEFFVELL